MGSTSQTDAPAGFITPSYALGDAGCTPTPSRPGALPFNVHYSPFTARFCQIG